MKPDLRNRLGWPSKKVVDRKTTTMKSAQVNDLPGWYVASLIDQWKAVDRAGEVFELFVNGRRGKLIAASDTQNWICVEWLS